MAASDTEAEDLAIQNTLSMTVEERLKLLAYLIVDKISEEVSTDRSSFIYREASHND